MTAEMFHESNVLVIELNSDEQFFALFNKVHDDAARALQNAKGLAEKPTEAEDGKEIFKHPSCIKQGTSREGGPARTLPRKEENKRKSKGKGAQERRRHRREQKKAAKLEKRLQRQRELMRRLFGDDPE